MLIIITIILCFSFLCLVTFNVSIVHFYNDCIATFNSFLISATQLPFICYVPFLLFALNQLWIYLFKKSLITVFLCEWRLSFSGLHFVLVMGRDGQYLPNWNVFSKYFPNKYIVSCVLEATHYWVFLPEGADTVEIVQCVSSMPHLDFSGLLCRPAQFSFASRWKVIFPFTLGIMFETYRGYSWHHFFFSFSSDALCSRTKSPNYYSSVKPLTQLSSF